MSCLMAATRSATSSIATRAKVNCSSRFTAAILIRLFCELIEGFARRDIVVAHRDRSRVIRALHYPGLTSSELRCEFISGRCAGLTGLCKSSCRRHRPLWLVMGYRTTQRSTPAGDPLGAAPGLPCDTDRWTAAQGSPRHCCARMPRGARHSVSTL